MKTAIKPEENHLKEIARVFLKLGFTGFGGPAVHIAMMEEEIVRKRQWLSHEHFIDLIGATNLIPGPNSTEMVIHLGHKRGGWRGLLIAGACFILPAVFITAIIAWAYQQYGHLPAVAPYIYGIKPAIIGVVVSLMVTLGRKALKSIELGVIGIACAILALFHFNEVIILFGAGVMGMGIYAVKNKTFGHKAVSTIPVLMLQPHVHSSGWKVF